MGFRSSYVFAVILYVIYIYLNNNNNYNNSGIHGFISTSKSSSSTQSKRLFYESVKRKRHNKRNDYKNTTTIVLVRLLILSGDIEVNPGPYSCERCHQVFDQKTRFDSHLTNQELVSCQHCTRNFCRSDSCRRHERTCPAHSSAAIEVGPGQWKCHRCEQIFKEHTRYVNHIRNREFVSCRYCHQNFCHRNRCQQHERSEHPQQPTETSQPVTGGTIDLDIPVIGDTKYQKMKGKCEDNSFLTL